MSTIFKQNFDTSKFYGILGNVTKFADRLLNFSEL